MIHIFETGPGSRGVCRIRKPEQLGSAFSSYIREPLGIHLVREGAAKLFVTSWNGKSFASACDEGR